MEIDTERFRQYAANFNSVRDFRELYKLFNNKTIDNRTIENTKPFKSSQGCSRRVIAVLYWTLRKTRNCIVAGDSH